MIPMFALARAVAHQRCSRAEADDVHIRRHQLGCARSRTPSHREGCIGARRRRRCITQECRECFRVGDLRFDQQSGTARNVRVIPPIAPLPPPVIASAAFRPEACSAEISDAHAGSDGRMFRPKLSCVAEGERQLRSSQ